MTNSDHKFGLPRYTLDVFFSRVVAAYAGRPAPASLGEQPSPTPNSATASRG